MKQLRKSTSRELPRTVSAALVLMALTLSAFSFGNTPHRALNLTQINKTLGQVFRQLTAKTEDVDFLSVQVTPETDIEKNRIGLKIDADFPRTVWSEDGALVSAKIQVAPTEKGGLIFQIDKKTKTDSVAALVHLAKMHGICPAPENIQGVERLLYQSDCQALESLKAAKSILEVGKIISDDLERAKNELASYSSALEEQGKVLSDDPTFQAWVESQRKLADSMSAVIAETKFVSTEEKLVLEMPAFQYGAHQYPQGLDLVMTSDSMKVTTAVEHSGGALFLKSLTPSIGKYLKGLERHRVFASKLATLQAMVLINFVRATCLTPSDEEAQTSQSTAISVR